MKNHGFIVLLSAAVVSAVAVVALAAQPAPAAAPAAAAPAPGGPTAGRGAVAPAVVPSTETKEHKDARMKWWREARFGMFIHWGIYSVPAGVYQGRNINGLGEWIMNRGKIPSAEYKKYAEQFNPTKFNAEEFVKIAKAAGQKYMIITAKHHDGFAMFKSADPFNIVDATPFKRDVIKELSDACKKEGIHFGVYYSQRQDWNHPGGDVQGGAPWDPTMAGNYEDYLNKVSVPQVKELLTNIKPEVLWWDTQGSTTFAQAKPLHDLLDLDPNIITNNRLGGGFTGDTETPEQNIPANGYPGGRDWETCMTINDTWGYKSTDSNFKSTETLLRNLIDIASKGGNYLLNVGPTAEGVIPQAEVDRLAAMGKWLSVNGEAIYGTGPNPFPAPPAATGPATRRAPVVWDWRATSKLDDKGNGKIYLHIFQWPAEGMLSAPFIPMEYKITKAYLLADPARAPLPVVTITGGAGTGFSAQMIMFPGKAPDPIASVICLEVTH